MCSIHFILGSIYLLGYSPVTDINQQGMSFPGEEYYPGEETLLFYTKIKHDFPLQAGLSLHF